MPDPTWLSYVGAATGIFGSITGSAGLALGYIGYRRSQELKALDLRLELRKAESDLRASVQELPDLLQRSRQSRTAVSAARGMARTGAFEGWKAAWENDMAASTLLAGELPEANKDYHDTKHRDLESKLVEVHALAARASRLRGKYLGELAADDRERDHIREDMRVQTQARLDNKQ